MPGQPFIGVTLDSEIEGYSPLPWYVVRENYCDCLAQRGGLPVPLPHMVADVGAYLDQLSGLLVTGGNFDVDPSLYGEENRHATVKTKSKRTDFEMAAITQALQRDMPVLGICGGAQLLNVVLGGSLIQHIPEVIPHSLPHKQTFPGHLSCHDIRIDPASHLFRLLQTATCAVNSSHHQCVKKLGQGVVANAWAADGVIEGIEVPEKSFCLGVQWHPEYIVTDCDGLLLDAFIEACKKYKKAKAVA